MHHKKAMAHMEKAMHHLSKHHEEMEGHHKKHRVTAHDKAVDRKNLKKARSAHHKK